MRGSNSVVESQPSKLLVAGSIPVSRSSARAAADEPVFRAAADEPVFRAVADEPVFRAVADEPARGFVIEPM